MDPKEAIVGADDVGSGFLPAIRIVSVEETVPGGDEVFRGLERLEPFVHFFDPGLACFDDPAYGAVAGMGFGHPFKHLKGSPGNDQDIQHILPDRIHIGSGVRVNVDFSRDADALREVSQKFEVIPGKIPFGEFVEVSQADRAPQGVLLERHIVVLVFHILHQESE